jgi:hypothetical protein
VKACKKILHSTQTVYLCGTVNQQNAQLNF